MSEATITDKEVDVGTGDTVRLWPAGMRRKEATINLLTDKEVDGCMGGAKQIPPTRKGGEGKACEVTINKQ